MRHVGRWEVKYKVGDLVFYKRMKVRIVFISRMGEILVNIHGYNEWAFHSAIKPVVRV